MAAVSHGVRPLRQGIGVVKSLHTPRPTLTANRLFRFVSNLFTPSSLAVSPQPAFIRPTHFSNSQSINARFSLPVRHALSRPFSPLRLPKPPVVPTNVTQVGLGSARAFHSGRPIFQNMVDNVPIATRALWEAEWDVKTKKKEARRMRRAVENKTTHQSRKPTPVMTRPSELDVYFPIQPVPAVTTHLLVPLAPTPTARLPLSAHNDGGGAHPLLPIADLASIHTTHRLHSLRVSTLFARLDAANVWDDPGVNVDAYAFGPRHNAHDTQEKQCTVLRVTFRGWNTTRVRSILGDSAEEWYSLEESHPDRHPDLRQTVYMNTRSQSPSLESVAREIDKVDPRDVPVSAQHDLVFPTLDFSDAVDNVPPPPPPVMFLRTVSELTRDAELASQSSSVLTDVQNSWECVGSNSSFAGEHGWDQFAEGA